ncbi:MAG: CoA-binding protein, partial [Octadecabacter sp.]|nr:CoA-binding protein [Octadecabacter sp.]
MKPDLSRLFQPKSIAVIGGGAWCRAVTEQLQKAAYEGEIWPIHPRSDDICGLKAYPTVLDAPAIPDAVFIGINRDATIGAVERLARIGAGGAVCFASGFGETEDGQFANARLLAAAGDMPILGPNCYGIINALDGVSLWPDQHGCLRVDKG